MKYEKEGLIIIFPQITCIEHGFDETSEVDYAVIHFGNGEFIEPHIVTGKQIGRAHV